MRKRSQANLSRTRRRPRAGRDDGISRLPGVGSAHGRHGPHARRVPGTRYADECARAQLLYRGMAPDRCIDAAAAGGPRMEERRVGTEGVKKVNTGWDM